MSKTRPLHESIDLAVDGIISALREERNFRIEIISAGAVVACGIILNLTRIELAILSLVIAVVLSAELFNTAIEKLLDMVNNNYDPKIKFIKDVSAGAVLLTAVFSVVVGYLIFYPHLETPFKNSIRLLRAIPYHLLVGGFILIILMVALLKGLYGDRFSKGGVVSGHSAVAFGLAIAILYLSGSLLISLLGFVLAFMVAQSRVEGNIHSWREVILGSFLGVIVMLTIFEFLLR
ncbi:MAG TPA: diacylglycerol kinase [bacterium]|nr:diacylglycerol kinase [bacterium]